MSIRIGSIGGNTCPRRQISTRLHEIIRSGRATAIQRKTSVGILENASNDQRRRRNGNLGQQLDRGGHRVLRHHFIIAAAITLHENGERGRHARGITSKVFSNRRISSRVRRLDVGNHEDKIRRARNRLLAFIPLKTHGRSAGGGGAETHSPANVNIFTHRLGGDHRSHKHLQWNPTAHRGTHGIGNHNMVSGRVIGGEGGDF